MSDLRVALVAEGPTDAIVIEAALKALLPRPFVLSTLQPEPTLPKLGGGWGGVLRWCREFAARGHARFEDDPRLPGYDLFVIHVDADVAEQQYADVSADIARLAGQRDWPTLPKLLPCPPPSGSADCMRSCLLAWSGINAPGPKTVLCVPSKAIEAWLAAAVFDSDHPLLRNIECEPDVAAQLKLLPIKQRIKKTPRDYRQREASVTTNWSLVRQRCTQADRFSSAVMAVLAH